MTRIALVVSDVDGTLVTHEKVLTDAAKGAVRRLRDAGVGFTEKQRQNDLNYDRASSEGPHQKLTNGVNIFDRFF